MKPLFSFLLLFISIISFAQDKIFPNDFFGIYRGKIEISSPQGKQEFDMEFHLKNTDTIGTYKYTLIYNKQARNYFLIEKDIDKGQYIIDENNGIILQTTVFNKAIYSIFEVMGNLISNTIHFYDTYIDFEIAMSRTSQIEITGKGTQEIPEVKTYPIPIIQKARLYKE